MGSVGIIAAFFGGLVSFFSPCVLPLVPAYLSMVTGVSVDELKAPEREQRMVVLRGILLFCAGFTVVFILLGGGTALVGSVLLRNRPVFEKVAGVLVVLMGLFLIGLLRPKSLERERRFQVAHVMGGWGAPVMGMAFAFGWTPCIGPVLGAILTIAASEGDVATGMGLLAVYSLGLAVPFVLSGLALSEMTRVFGWVKRNFRAINITAGSVMIVFGVMIFTGTLTRLSLWMFEVLDSAGIRIG